MSAETPIEWETLMAAAIAAQGEAYAPYSRFVVGAALLAEDGRIFVGANVENASFGLAACAERNAIGAAVTAGSRRFRALAVVTPGPTPATPCGMCRQVLSEFPPSFPVRCHTIAGAILDTSVAELLPHAFGPSHLTDRD